MCNAVRCLGFKSDGGRGGGPGEERQKMFMFAFFCAASQILNPRAPEIIATQLRWFLSGHPQHQQKHAQCINKNMSWFGDPRGFRSTRHATGQPQLGPASGPRRSQEPPETPDMQLASSNLDRPVGSRSLKSTQKHMTCNWPAPTWVGQFAL